MSFASHEVVKRGGFSSLLQLSPLLLNKYFSVINIFFPQRNIKEYKGKESTIDHGGFEDSSGRPSLRMTGCFSAALLEVEFILYYYLMRHLKI